MEAAAGGAARRGGEAMRGEVRRGGHMSGLISGLISGWLAGEASGEASPEELPRRAAGDGEEG